MKQDNKLFDDLAKLAGNALGTFASMKNEIETLIAQKMEGYFQKMHMVSREEFDVVRELVVKAREEQEQLKQRIAELEATREEHHQ